MNNSDDKPNNGRTPEEEEAHRNLVGFFQLLWDIDNRLKHKESSQPKSTPKKKLGNPPGSMPTPKVFEKKPSVQETYIPPNIPSRSAPIKLQPRKKLTKTITIRLDADTFQRIRVMARQKEVGPTTLIRLWVMEQIGKQRVG